MNRSALLRLFVFVTFVLSALPAPAQSPALIYYVDGARPDDTGDGRSWAGAKKTLSAALATTTTARQVWVKRGIYVEAINVPSNVELYGGFAGDETTLTQRVIALHETVLSGGRSFTPVTMDKTQNTLMDGFIITEGVNLKASGGGVICTQTKAPTLFVQCVITSNTGTGGGGVFLNAATAMFTSCTLSDNVSTPSPYSSVSAGGGIYAPNGGATITGCRIINNSAASSGGGAYISGNGSTVTGSLVAGNVAADTGGGFYFLGSNATFSECVISGNRARYGGGMRPGNDVKAVNCVFSGNQATEGAAVFGGTRNSFTHCTFDGNQADCLGGALCFEQNGFALTNCILSRNTGCAVVENHSGVRAVYPMGLPTLNTSFKNCLFSLNPDGDFWRQAFHGREGTKINGSVAINKVTGCSGNKDGNPNFAMDGPGGLTGAWSAVEYTSATNRTTLTDAAAALTTGALEGRMIAPDQEQYEQAVILSNTATRVVVAGKLEGVAAGDRYRVADWHLRDGSAALEGALGGYGMPSADMDGDARPGSDNLRDIGVDEAPAEFVRADVTPPVTRVGAIEPAYSPYVPHIWVEFDIPFTALDAESGLKSVTLYYRFNGGAWTPYGAPVSASPIHFIQPEDRNGVYEFYTVGVDQQNNVEPPPMKPDARTVALRGFSGPVVYVNGAAGLGGDGSSWAKAVPDIATGVAIANLFNVSATWVARGTYKEMISYRGNLFGGFAGNETVLSQREVAANPTIIDAGSLTPTDAVVKLNGGRLDGFTVTAGYCYKSSAPTHRGGGVYCSGSDTTVANCRITCNRALYGGGVYCEAGSRVYIDRCQIHGNEASETGGGIAYREALVIVANSVVSGNVANRGGGLGYCYLAGEYDGTKALGVQIVHCTIAMNYAKLSGGGGGGVSHVQTATTGSPTFKVHNSIIHGNVGSSIIYSGGAGSLYVTRSQFNSSVGSINGVAGCTVEALNALPNCRGNISGSNTYRKPDAFANPNFPPTWPYASYYDPFTNVTTIPCYGQTTYLDIAPGELKGYLVTIYLETEQRQFLIEGNDLMNLWVKGDVSDYIQYNKFFDIFDYRLERGSAAIDAGEALDLGFAFDTDLDGRKRPCDIRNVGLDSAGFGYDLGAYETYDYPCQVRVAQTANGVVTSDPAPVSAGNPFYLGGVYGTTVTLTATPDAKCRFVRWNGNAPALAQGKNPMVLTLDGDIRVSATFARESGGVRVDATPNTAPWTFTDADGKSYSGVGDGTVAGVPTGTVTFTWGALANYDRPAPNPVTRTLALDTTITVRGVYAPHLGTVNINVAPAKAGWTLTDGAGGKRTGVGPARLTGVVCGALKLAWIAPAGYLAPAVNPAALGLTKGQEIFVGECMAPAAAATTPALRTQNSILRYLLGITVDKTGLDLNGDGAVTVTDLLRARKP